MSKPSASSVDERAPQSTATDLNLTHLALVIIFGIFATTLPQPQVLGRLPITFLLKDELKCTREQVSSFWFLCGLAWYFKPLAGILTDAFPLFKTRRRHYILISSVCSVLSWIALGLVPHTYQALLLTSIIVNFFMVITSTVVGAYLVEAGQRIGATGRLTALRQIVSNTATLINGPLGGFLASGLFLTAAGVNAVMVFSIFPIVWIFLRENKVSAANTHAIHNAGIQLKKIFSSRNLWFALLFIGLFYFAPGFGTVLTYRQADELHFTKQFIGNLGVFAGAAGIIAAFLYGVLIKKVSIRTIMALGIAIAAVGTLLYTQYNGQIQAILIDSQNGFFFTIAEVALLDLAARATPSGCEGLGYSLILSVRNIALFGADVLGSKLADEYHWPFHNLVYLNAITTAIVLILLPFMPRALMIGKDKSNPTPEADPEA